MNDAKRPNIILLLADDLGFSDVGCYGGEIETPEIDRLARDGVRFAHFYNTARCSPSRASLLTGRHPHETGIGVLTGDRRPYGYPGDLSPDVPTIAEILTQHGYATGMVGKWHLSKDIWEPSASWPTRRGFGFFWGTISGTSSYFAPATLRRGETDAEYEALRDGFYYTTAIGEEGRRFVRDAGASGSPFFLYVAFTAPHWPLHAPADSIDRYRGRFDEGWDLLREKRLERAVAAGVLSDETRLSARDETVPAWEDEPDRSWQAKRMEVYAAQVDEMDRAIGRILDPLRESGEIDNTVILFLSDNGASAEEVPVGDPRAFVERRDLFNKLTRAGEPVRLGNDPSVAPGPETTYGSYGRAWANTSNAPFRRYKKWVHEGGVATPFILSWPSGPITAGDVCDHPAQLTSVLPTVLDAAGILDENARRAPSLLPALSGKNRPPGNPLFWEHCGNAAARIGKWKLARVSGEPWELYDIEEDPTEMDDVASIHPDVVADLSDRWQRWADDVGVIPFDRIVEGVVSSGLAAEVAER